MSPQKSIFYNLFVSHIRLFDLHNRSMLPCLSSPAVLMGQVVDSAPTCLRYSIVIKLWALLPSVSLWPFQVHLCLVSPSRSILMRLHLSSCKRAWRVSALQRPTGLWNTANPTGPSNPLMSSLKSKGSVTRLLRETEIASCLSNNFHQAEISA